MGNESLFLKHFKKGISGLNLSIARELFSLRTKVEELSSKTARNYEYVLGFFSQWVLRNLNSDMQVQEIEPHTLRQYLFYLQEKNLSKPTLATHYRNLKAFFNFLKREGYIKENPIERIPAFKLSRQYPHILEDIQVSELLQAPNQKTWEGYRNYVILLTFLDTGMRVEELIRLNLQDINLGTRSIIIQEGKGDKSRQVFMGKKLTKAMHRWIEQRGYKAYEEALFTTRQGERLKQRNLEKIIERLAKKAGITGVRCYPHTLCHTFATSYIRNGGDPFSLQQLLAHSDIKTCMIYVHMAGVHLREAHAKYSPVDRMSSL